MTDETKKAADDAWLDYEYQDGCLYSTTFRDGFCKGFDAALSLLQWKDVADGLPDDGGVYRVRLAARPDVEMNGAYFPDRRENIRWTDAFTWEPIQITHWRPLDEKKEQKQ